MILFLKQRQPHRHGHRVEYLPKRYAVDSAIVIDSNGKTSDQMDVVIYDPQYTPTLLDQHDHKYIPAEAVYAVMEVKPTVNKGYLDYAGKKAASVRRLNLTSAQISEANARYNVLIQQANLDYQTGVLRY